MITKFGFRNFSSFKEGAEISFEGGINASMREPELGTVLGIKGANGSGKTNILKAIAFLFCFCSSRMQTRSQISEGDEIISLPLDSFFENDDVSEFYVEVILKGITYYYELDLTQKGVVREELRRKKTKEITFLIREKGKIAFCLKEFEELKSLKLKKDQSIISIVENFNFNSPMKDLSNLYKFFSNIIFNVGRDGYRSVVSGFDKTSEFYFNNKKALEFTKLVIAGVDGGVSDIRIKDSIDSSTGKVIYHPVFIHNYKGKSHQVSLSNESMGTKTLFLHLSIYWQAIQKGSLMVMDEFDTHLHANILPELIGLFQDTLINSNNSQLIVTAHNTEIIDSLGRYGTILVNKENNESYCYRLDEVNLLRNDRLLSPVYKKGKIGGVPKEIEGLTSKLSKKWASNNNG